MLVLVGYSFSGPWGHVGVLLTGLGRKSCFLHYHAQNRDPYPKHRFAPQLPTGLYSHRDWRVCIPSAEDGNHPTTSASEAAVLAWWKAKKVALLPSYPQGDRRAAFAQDYGSFGENCARYANRLIAAAVQHLPALAGEMPGTWHLNTPSGSFEYASEVRDTCLRLNSAAVYYGWKLEGDTTYDVDHPARYKIADNIEAGSCVALPRHQALPTNAAAPIIPEDNRSSTGAPIAPVAGPRTFGSYGHKWERYAEVTDDEMSRALSTLKQVKRFQQRAVAQRPPEHERQQAFALAERLRDMQQYRGGHASWTKLVNRARVTKPYADQRDLRDPGALEEIQNAARTLAIRSTEEQKAWARSIARKWANAQGVTAEEKCALEYLRNQLA